MKSEKGPLPLVSFENWNDKGKHREHNHAFESETILPIVVMYSRSVASRLGRALIIEFSNSITVLGKVGKVSTINTKSDLVNYIVLFCAVRHFGAYTWHCTNEKGTCMPLKRTHSKRWTYMMKEVNGTGKWNRYSETCSFMSSQRHTGTFFICPVPFVIIRIICVLF